MLLRKSLMALVLAISFDAYAAEVAQGNITDFTDGTPAIAAQVNGNFGELISQINNNHERIDAIEQSALVSGGIGLVVNCDDDGLDALDNAINNSNNPTGNLFITASGTCGHIEIKRRNVIINGVPSVTIHSDGDNADPIVIGGALDGIVLLNITVDGQSKASHGIYIKSGAQVAGVNLSVKNAINQQVLVDGGRLFLAGVNSFGDVEQAADALTISLYGGVGVLPFAQFTSASLALLSSQTALELSGASVISNQAVGSSILISGIEVEVESGSRASFRVADIAVSDRFSVRDNSILNVELSSGTDAFTLDGKLLLDRGSVGKLSLEDAVDGATLTHTGDLEVGGNSFLEAYGRTGTSNTVTMASGGEAGFFVNSTFVGNSMTFGATAIEVLDATFVLSDDTALSTAPGAIEARFGGKLILEDTLINIAINRCSTGATAFQFDETDRCPVPPS